MEKMIQPIKQMGVVHVSIVILTCNRVEILSELLRSLEEQSFRDFEIIVVDNNSSDGTPIKLRDTFPHVRLIALSENTGCGGRNVGIKNANGNIVVTIDDDVFFKNNTEIEKLVNLFENNKDVHVVNFKVLDYYTSKMASFNWYHPRSMEQFCDATFETDYISEGAVAFKKEIFHASGYYHEDFFLGHEGIDLSYRIIDCGYKIIYAPEIEVLHKHSLIQRTEWRGSYYDTRNYIWLFIRHYPIKMLITNTVYRLVTTFIFSLSRKQLYWYFKAVKDAILGIQKQLNQRKPIKKSTIKRLAEINRCKPSILSKIKNFNKRRKERSY